jgi:hypothetical protein
MTFEYLYTIITHARVKHKQPFTIRYCVDNVYPWKDIVGKKMSKLRSIAELRAFYGTYKRHREKSSGQDPRSIFEQYEPGTEPQLNLR